jgi:hypothetical protein
VSRHIEYINTFSLFNEAPPPSKNQVLFFSAAPLGFHVYDKSWDLGAENKTGFYLNSNSAIICENQKKEVGNE